MPQPSRPTTRSAPSRVKISDPHASMKKVAPPATKRAKKPLSSAPSRRKPAPRATQERTLTPHQKKSRRRLFTLCFVISLVLVALYWGVVAILIATRSDGNEDALPLLVFTQGERKEDKRFEPEEACINGVKYLPITFLEKYMAITQFGDDKTRSFQLCETGEYATFYLGTEEAIINGQHVSIKAPAILKDKDLYLPLDFFEDKMNCFELGLNNSTYGADVLTFNKDVKPSFLFRSMPTSDPVLYDPVYAAPPTPEDPAAQPTA